MNDLPRILYVTGSELDRRTGAAVNEREFIRALLDCEACKAHAIAPLRDAALRPDGLPAERCTLIPSHGGRWRGVPGFAWRLHRAIGRVTQTFAPDLVLHRLTAIPLVEWWAARRSSTPRALKTLISPYALVDQRFGPLGRFARWLSRRATGAIVRQAIAVDTVSPAWREWLLEEYSPLPEQVDVVSNGAALDRFLARRADQQVRPSARPRFLFAGSLRSLFCLELVFDAIASLPPEARSFELVIAGTGPDEAPLRRRAAELGLAGLVQFLGWVDYERLPELMWSCHWGLDLTDVSAPLAAGPRPTFFSQKASQYLAAGLPVLAWDIDGAEFLTQQSLGLTAGYRDVDRLAERLSAAAAAARTDGFARWQERAREFALAERSQAQAARVRVERYQPLLNGTSTAAARILAARVPERSRLDAVERPPAPRHVPHEVRP